eukprot:7485963-Prorocentrum_lima.AAC.1
MTGDHDLQPVRIIHVHVSNHVMNQVRDRCHMQHLNVIYMTEDLAQQQAQIIHVLDRNHVHNNGLNL